MNSATIMPTKPTTNDSSSSFSRSSRHFQWRKKLNNVFNTSTTTTDCTNDNYDPEETLNSFSSLSLSDEYNSKQATTAPAAASRKKLTVNVTVARLRSALTALAARRARLMSSSSSASGLGTRVVGTLFGHRRGHVHFAIQEDPKSPPALLIELATPINGLVKEIASGLVRIALECDKSGGGGGGGDEGRGVRLLQEPVWRTYCNGKKCGFAKKRECGEEELKVLKAVEPISMGAGVLPGNGGGGEGEVMYLRAKFERVVGSRDSEAFYMMNPDSNCGPELSVYLLRI